LAAESREEGRTMRVEKMRVENAFRAAHRLAVCGSARWGVALSEERVAEIVAAATAAAPCEAIAVATAIAEIDTAASAGPTAHMWGAAGWGIVLTDEDEDGSGEKTVTWIGPAGPIHPDEARAWVRVMRADGTTAIEAEVLIGHSVRAESCSAPRSRGDSRPVTERELERLLGAVGALVAPRDWPERRDRAEHLLRADLDAIVDAGRLALDGAHR